MSYSDRNWQQIEFLRDKLTQPDRYADALAAQNLGGECPHCYSESGHFNYCPLINRESAEAHSIALNQFTEADRIVLHGLGVAL